MFGRRSGHTSVASVFAALAAALSISLLSVPAQALPIVSVDVDPGTPGIQSTRNVAPLSSFSVDIVVEGIEPLTPLNGFVFTLDFNSAAVGATGVADGGFLLPPAFSPQNDINPNSVTFAEATLGIGAVSGGGILATVTFDAVAVGFSFLNLNNVILTGPPLVFPIPGDIILLQTTNDGSVTVGDPQVIPVPGAALLFGTGLVGLAFFRRRRRGA